MEGFAARSSAEQLQNYTAHGRRIEQMNPQTVPSPSRIQATGWIGELL
jgi:hypothetical protein